MNRLIFYLLVVIATPCLAQHEFSLASFADLPSADYHNPAWHDFTPGWSLDFGHLRHYFFHTGGTFNDLIDETPEGLRLKLSNLQQGLQGTNFFQTHLEARSIGARWNSGRLSVGISHELHIATDFSYNDALVNLLVEGNQNLVGETVHLDLDGFFHSYNDFGISVAWRLGAITLGVRPRLLLGNQLLLHDTRNLRLFTAPEFYQTTLISDLDIYSAGTLDLEENNLFNYDFLGLAFWDFSGQNRGLALDAGVSYSRGPMRAGIAVRDLGFIQWNQTSRYQSSQSETYAGITVADVLDIDLVRIGTGLDSLRTLLDVTQDQVDFRQTLDAQIAGSLTFLINSKWLVGGHLQFHDRSQARWTTGLNSWYQIFPALKMGASATWRNDQLQWGLFGAISVQAVHFYVAFDQVGQVLNPLRSSDYQLSAGFALVIGQRSP